MAAYLREGADPETVRAEILASLDEGHQAFIYTNRDLRSEVLRVFDSTFAITYALEIIAIVVAMLGVGATLLTLVVERRRELSLLRLIGAARRQVQRVVVIEAALIGAASQAIGLVVGLALSMVLVYVINVQSFGWTIQFRVPVLFLLQVVAGGGWPLPLAGLYPARRAGRNSGADRTRMNAGAGVHGCSRSWMPGGRWRLIVLTRRARWRRRARRGARRRPAIGSPFPRDHASHPEFKLEWWYYTGNLETATGRRFGYQVTFFRVGVDPAPENPSAWAVRDLFMAHLAVSDPGRRALPLRREAHPRRAGTVRRGDHSLSGLERGLAGRAGR